MDTVDIPMAFVGRADGLRILGVFDEGTYQCTGAATATPGDTDSPAIGTAGLTVDARLEFDGWGYAHLYDANTSEEIDAFAIPEALDERYADRLRRPVDPRVRDRSDHEPGVLRRTTRAACGSSASAAPAGWSRSGSFIDADGNNFWGVEQFTDAAGNRLIAALRPRLRAVHPQVHRARAVLAPPPSRRRRHRRRRPPPPPAGRADGRRRHVVVLHVRHAQAR